MPTPTLQREQFQYTDTGVLLNGNPPVPFCDLTAVRGLDAAPLRVSSTDREGTDGSWTDALFESTRTVTLEGTVFANPTTLETYLDSLKANYAPVVTPAFLYFGADASVRGVLGRSLGFRYDKEQARRLGSVDFQIQVLCDDPRIYTPDPVTATLPGTLNLSGNRNTTGTITINGPRTNPTITLGTSVLTFALTIASGSVVVIDLDKRTAVLDGTTNVRGAITVTGGWPVLKAGNNSFTIGGTGTGTIIASARSAWR